jgi:hypothetical protein
MQQCILVYLCCLMISLFGITTSFYIRPMKTTEDNIDLDLRLILKGKLLLSRFVILLSLWYLLIIPMVSSDYPYGIFWLSLWYLLIIPLVSFDYPFGIFWLSLWYLLITPLVSSNFHIFNVTKSQSIFF